MSKMIYVNALDPKKEEIHTHKPSTTTNHRMLMFTIVAVVATSSLIGSPLNSAAASPHQPESDTLEYLCLKYKAELAVNENDCHEMFYNNEVKIDTGVVFACKVAKIAGNQLPTLVRVPLRYVECHADIDTQISGIFDRGQEMAKDIGGLLGVR